MLSSLTTNFIGRLRANDQAAWFELWETFGPVVRAQLMKWGKGRIGAETVRDLSQETLAALSESIDRYDPTRGARFSTWLLAIAKHVLGDELDKRSALKRGGSQKNAEFDESWMSSSKMVPADEAYEAAVFRAKVEAALRMVEKATDFMDFSIYRMRVLEGQPGKDVAKGLGISEPTVSRRLAKVRTAVRERLVEVIATYSFTAEEREEATRNGVALNPKKASSATDNGTGGLAEPDDVAFDEAICEIYHRQMDLRREDQAQRLR
ncbi:MAG: RNA polymerase sigma factor [Phycisphaerales bacterium]|nr:MAG: sigma-70 family RNA polymerase sigma factor [Phycisphaerales bacterium]